MLHSKRRTIKMIEQIVKKRIGWIGILFTLLFSALLEAQQAASTLDGTLNIVWGDPHPERGVGGKAVYSLATTEGRIVPLQLTGQEGLATQYLGRRVVVTGRRAQNQMAPASAFESSDFIVDEISPVQGQLSFPKSANVSGTKKVMFLLLKFSDDTAVPHQPAFYINMTNPDTPPSGEVFSTTINGFYKKTSGNQFSWAGDVGGAGGIGASGGWLTLPQTKNFYAPCGWSGSCAKLTQLGDDGMALGRAAGIDFMAYDNINFVLSNDLDCCSWGGGYYSSVDKKSYGATWEPPWGQETGTYVHEMGHSLGLPHSGWVYYAYDSPWDMMSDRMAANSVSCGSYNSKNSNGTSTISCTEPGDGFIASYKDYLNWIPDQNKATTDTSSTTILTLEGAALPLDAEIKYLKICITGVSCTGSSAHYFTVEARVKGLGPSSQYDNGIPNEGIIIHDFQGNRSAISGSCFFNNQSGWAVPVDATPGDYDSINCNSGGRSYLNYALFNAQYNVGQMYTNNTYGFQIRVLSRSGSTFQVSVNPFSAAKRKGQIISY
jgi:hypothetical protein